MLLFALGASGSGKSSYIEPLSKLLPAIQIHDFDDIGVPDDADKIWRQQSTEKWLQRYLSGDNERNHLQILNICNMCITM